MGGIDKALRCSELVEHGWKEVSDNRLVPPDELWNNKPKSFDVCDAIDLQSMLGNKDNMTENLKYFCGFGL